MSLPKKNRFQRKFLKNQSGKIFSSSKHFSFKQKENANKTPKFSVIVSSKIINKANKRNLIKRRIKEVIRKFIKENTTPSGFFYVKGGAGKLSFKEIEKEVLFLLKKAKS